MPLRCDKEGHGTRGDSEKAVQGVHDRFGDSEKAVQGVHGRFTHCKRAAQVLHGRFTHCERAVQVLHSPATHCERAAQVLHSHFTHCERAVQVLHSHFTHCERAVQVLHSHFTHCAGATHVLHTHFTHCDGLRKGGRREFTRLRRFTPKPLFARYDRDNSPPRSRSPDSLHRARKPPGHRSDLIGPLPLAPIFRSVGVSIIICVQPMSSGKGTPAQWAGFRRGRFTTTLQ